VTPLVPNSTHNTSVVPILSLPDRTLNIIANLFQTFSTWEILCRAYGGLVTYNKMNEVNKTDI
jgi:hypothetical protein